MVAEEVTEVTAGTKLGLRQEAVEPSVYRYLPELPVTLGTWLIADHEATEPLLVRNLPELEVIDGMPEPVSSSSTSSRLQMVAPPESFRTTR